MLDMCLDRLVILYKIQLYCQCEISVLTKKYSPVAHRTLTCEEHTPSYNGYEKIAGLGNELEGSIQMKQCEYILQSQHRNVMSQGLTSTNNELPKYHTPYHVALMICNVYSRLIVSWQIFSSLNLTMKPNRPFK